MKKIVSVLIILVSMLIGMTGESKGFRVIPFYWMMGVVTGILSHYFYVD